MIKRKILFYLILFTSIPLLFFMGYFYFYERNGAEKDAMRTLTAGADRCASIIDSALAVCVEKSLFVTSNRYINAYLQRNFDNNLEEIYSFHQSINSILDSLNTSTDTSYGGLKIFTDNETLFPGKYIEPIANLNDPALAKRIMKEPLSSKIWADSVKSNIEGADSICLYRNMNLLDKSIGILVVDFPFAKIRSYMKEFGLPEKGLIQYLDKNGRCVFVQNDSGLDVSAGGSLDPSRFMTCSTVLLNGHRLIVAIPMTFVHKKQEKTLSILLCVFIAVILIIIFTSNMTSKRITSDLERFIHEISSNDDMLLNEHLIPVDERSEVSLIMKRFKSIIGRMNDLFNELFRVKLQYKSLEVELLQSMINPHLLYNSLSVVKWAAIGNNDRRTIEIIDTMSRYYRMALNKGNSILTVREELRMLEEYVRLNEVSRNCKYNFVVDVDEQVKDCHTFKHILQPIVENAILHAFDKEMKNASITVEGRFDQGDIILRVSDNGHGMTAGMVENIMNFNYKSQYGGYGLMNNIKRIQAYYGENYGMDIRSAPGEGTIVTIRIVNLGEKELTDRIAVK